MASKEEKQKIREGLLPELRQSIIEMMGKQEAASYFTTDDWDCNRTKFLTEDWSYTDAQIDAAKYARWKLERLKKLQTEIDDIKLGLIGPELSGFRAQLRREVAARNIHRQVENENRLNEMYEQLEQKKNIKRMFELAKNDILRGRKMEQLTDDEIRDLQNLQDEMFGMLDRL